MSEAEMSVPRWIQVPVGLLRLPFALICLAGSVILIMSPPAKNPPVAIAFGSVMVLMSLWGVEEVARLVFGWRTQGGLMAPMSLRLIGVFFLLLPLIGFCTGHNGRVGLVGILQAIAYVSISVGLFTLASKTRGAGAQQAVQRDGPASGGSTL